MEKEVVFGRVDGACQAVVIFDLTIISST